MTERKRKYWVGFDLGGTKMLAVVCDDSGTILGREKKKTRAFEGQEAGLARMEAVIREALKNADVEPSEVAGIGMGVPGPLNLDQGIILDTPNMGWKNVKIKNIFEKIFSCPVVIGNDVDIGTYGEYRYGAGKNQRCVLGVFPGTGVGGGCIYEGKIFRGRIGSCMEVGHMVIHPGGVASGTGLGGTLEALTSRLAIAQGAAGAAVRGQAPALMEECGTDIRNMKSKALARSVEAGDRAVEALVEDAAEWLGIGIANLINVLSPDIVVLGGGMIDAFPEQIIRGVKKSTIENVMPAFRGTYKVVAAELGDDAGCLGAASWAMECIAGAC